MCYSTGKIALVIDSDWHEPESNSTIDKEAAEIKQLFTVSIEMKLFTAL